MNLLKGLVKTKRFIIWAIVTVFIVGLLITANILADVYRIGLNNVFSGERAVTEQSEHADLFLPDFKTKAEALENGGNVTKKICEEGMVLLKNENNALTLKANAKVSVFGKNSVNLVYGGSGSAMPKSTPTKKTLKESLEAAGLKVNPTLHSFYTDSKKSGTGRTEVSGFSMDSLLETGETSIDKYTADVVNSYGEYKDAAIVVFSRIAGENWDLPRFAADNKKEEGSNKYAETRHYLELDKNESALLKHIEDSNKFDHIIVLINSSNSIDLGFLKMTDDPNYSEKIDGAFLIGSPGGVGAMAIGELLTGKVNPSGRTIDTLYTHYEQDPTFPNFGDIQVWDETEKKYKGNDSYILNNSEIGYYFADYEENIYLGYRYYETAAKEAAEGNYAGFDYNKRVVYPFGHGLSYTEFEETLVNKADLEAAKLNANESFDVQVKVKNTGEKAGKQVVQLYASAPYTKGGIEKAHKVLVGFAKTKLLKANEEETVTIKVTPYDFASFDADDKNMNNFKGWELEKGVYNFYVSKNAHEEIESFTKTLDNDARFENDPTTGTKVEPLFEGSDAHLQQSLSRDDFVSTFPQMATKEDRTIDDAMKTALDDRTVNYDPAEVANMPTTGVKDITVMFEDLIELPYDDPKWDEFLNQLTIAEMASLFNDSCYSTPAIERLGIPKTISFDGPTGLVNFQAVDASKAEIYDTTYYCSECLVAQTYNVELAEEQGKAIGNEALIGDERSSHLPYTGWYGPGVNLHRSPFAGRCTEYYSEDPFISGKMAAAVIRGAQEKGVYANVKHFALNEQETHRGLNGDCSWVNEQAIRELYLKPFEFAVKEGKTKGLMTSFNRIGSVWAGGSYELVTTVLRKEWGFVGSVICDYHTDGYMNNRQMIYAGGDVNLTFDKPWTKYSTSDAGDVNVLRRSAHNLLYCIANSNAVRAKILYYLPARWQVMLWVADGVVPALLIGYGVAVFLTFRAKKKKEDPEA